MDCDSKTITHGVAEIGTGAARFPGECDSARHGLTSFAGLPLYLEMIAASGLAGAVRKHVQAAGRQGWFDVQMTLAVVLLNLAGGDCVEDIERLERDRGFAGVLRAIETTLLCRAERRSLSRRFRRGRERATPSPSELLGWLERFHDRGSAKATAEKAFIPEALAGLWRVN